MDIDWGALDVYTCTNSCYDDSNSNTSKCYEEYIFVQQQVLFPIQMEGRIAFQNSDCWVFPKC